VTTFQLQCLRLTAMWRQYSPSKTLVTT